ncbi:MAG: hypothetical protein AABW48_01540 [Nanoarchaeota archaeon]
MELKKVYESFLDGRHQVDYRGELVGTVTSVEKVEKKESILKIKVESLEEIVRLPKRVHPEILVGSKIRYIKSVTECDDHRVVGYETHAGEASPVMEYFKSESTKHFLEIIEGKFEGIEYRAEEHQKKQHER